jgi:hypothetical protein
VQNQITLKREILNGNPAFQKVLSDSSDLKNNHKCILTTCRG